MTRRGFAKSVTGTTGFFTANLWPQVSVNTSRTNDTIGVGIIGAGIMGRHHLQHLLQEQRQWNIKVRAVCDIFDLLRDNAIDMALGSGEKIAVYNDFRDLLARQDIDAVFIATPDHWHAIQTIEACKAGKDIYVQKPISTDVYESRMMVETVRKHKRVVQVGTQQASWNNFKDAITLVHSGVIGKITEVETFMYGVDIFPGPFNLPDSEPPLGLDWNMWLGPAPHPPYGPKDVFNADIFGVDLGTDSTNRSVYGSKIEIGRRKIYQRGTWRVTTRPFGGLQTDWGVHLVDIVLRAMQVPGPIAVSSHGGNWVYKDNRQLPDTQITTWEFPEFVCTFKMRSGNNYTYDKLPQRFDRSHGILFFGKEGTLFVNRSGYFIEPNHGKKIEPPSINGRVFPLEGRYDNRGDDAHVGNFFECMRNRQETTAPIERGRFATDMCISAMASYWSRKRLKWDPENGISDSIEAWPYLNYEHREPWKISL